MSDPPLGEQARLDAHFLRTLSTLHQRTPARSSRVQRRARAEHLRRLDAYRQRGVFPKNRRFLGRALPHFIDEAGTRCAMGHLIEATGGTARDVVQYIARERNFDRVQALANISELGDWLEANGLTLDEAALIQPSYCGSPAENCVCHDAFWNGMVQGTLTEGGAELAVTQVYGLAVGSVEVGDVLPFFVPDYITVAPGDIVFASVSQSGASAQFVVPSAGSMAVIDPSACVFPQTAIIPGPLPLDVVSNALSSSSLRGCEAVLAAHDPTWATENGGPDCLGEDAGTGGYAGSGGSGGAVHDAGPSSVDDAGAPPSADANGGCSLRASADLGTGAALAFALVFALGAARRIQRR